MTAADLAAIVRTAAERTVAAHSKAESTGDGLADLAWMMLGGVVAHKEGLTAFAAEVIRAHAEARPTAERVAAAVIDDNYGDATPGALVPLDALASALRQRQVNAGEVEHMLTAAARAGGAR